jgi:hypothetical protein
LPNAFEWSLEHVIGYIGTWSAVKHYEKENGRDPVELIHEDLRKPISGKVLMGKFPILLRVATI